MIKGSRDAVALIILALMTLGISLLDAAAGNEPLRGYLTLSLTVVGPVVVANPYTFALQDHASRKARRVAARLPVFVGKVEIGAVVAHQQRRAATSSASSLTTRASLLRSTPT